MTEVNFYKINDGLKECAKGNSFMLETNSYVENLFRIILKNYYLYKNDKIEYKPLEISESIKKAGMIFKEIDSVLYDSFNNIITDKKHTTITITKNRQSYVDGEKIFLNLTNTSRDIIEIIHESIHKVFNPKIYKIEEVKHIIRLFFNELNSITFERIANDKLDIDKDKFLYERFISDMEKSIFYMFYNFVFKIYLKRGNVNIDIIKEEINNIQDLLLKQIFIENLDDNIVKLEYNSEYLAKFQVQISRYIIASVLSASIYKNIKDGKMTYKDCISKMEELNNINNYMEGLDLFGLNYIKSNNVLEQLDYNYNKSCELLAESRNR
ncbi:MAG: hypothetical protein E7158_05905 [Firmicutes bacterium]|nr:hypothetical protein [Bacillota bacterium]